MKNWNYLAGAIYCLVLALFHFAAYFNSEMNGVTRLLARWYLRWSFFRRPNPRLDIFIMGIVLAVIGFFALYSFYKINS